MSRADAITQLTKTPTIFSDFITDFTPHPITGDIVRVTNTNAVKQSLKSLILTNLGERLFQPFVGSNISKALFEFNDTTTAQDIEFHIRQTITNNEPRVSIQMLTVNYDTTRDTVFITMTFFIINNLDLQTIDLFIKRVR